jgi:heterodisulfide reductase subunit B
MKYAFFPGCAVHGSAEEYIISCNAVSEILDIELIEIPDWNCCSAIDAVYTYDPDLSISLAARNLALAEKMKMDLVTLCSACYFTLSRANKLLHEDQKLKSKVNKVLNNIGLNYNSEVKGRHYLDILLNDVGLEKISKYVKVTLKELKVAPYYGCLLVRPPEITKFDDPEHPKSMDKLIEALGATSLGYTDKVRCCGASLMITKEEIAMEMTKNLLLNAKNAEADCIVTPCPMCHFNLDAKQQDVESFYDIKIDLPILYFTQLIGIAYGLSSKELGLNRNCVSTKQLMKQFQST